MNEWCRLQACLSPQESHFREKPAPEECNLSHNLTKACFAMTQGRAGPGDPSHAMAASRYDAAAIHPLSCTHPQALMSVTLCLNLMPMTMLCRLN